MKQSSMLNLRKAEIAVTTVRLTHYHLKLGVAVQRQDGHGILSLLAGFSARNVQQ